MPLKKSNQIFLLKLGLVYKRGKISRKASLKIYTFRKYLQISIQLFFISAMKLLSSHGHELELYIVPIAYFNIFIGLSKILLGYFYYCSYVTEGCVDFMVHENDINSFIWSDRRQSYEWTGGIQQKKTSFMCRFRAVD